MKKYLILLLPLLTVFGYAQTLHPNSGTTALSVNNANTLPTTVGGTNTYTATLPSAGTITDATNFFTDITDRLIYYKFTNAATSAPFTLNLNGEGARILKKRDATGSIVDIVAADISVGQVLPIRYNGTYLVIESGGAGGGGITALTGDISASGSGSVIATINPNVIIDAYVNPLASIAGTKIANVASGGISSTNVQDAINELDDEKALKYPTTNTVTTSYVAALTDAGNFIEMDAAGSTTITIPTQASVAWPDNTILQFIQKNTGAFTVTAAGGVTFINYAGNLVSAGEGDLITAKKISTNLWYVFSNPPEEDLQPQLNGTGFVKATGTTISYDNSTYLTGNQSITLTPSGDVTGSASGATSLTPTFAIGANKVLDGMIRQSAGLSVIGRSANTTGNVTDITAASDNTILSRSGTTIGFNALTAAMVPDAVAWKLGGNTLSGAATIGSSSAQNITYQTGAADLYFNTNSTRRLTANLNGLVFVGIDGSTPYSFSTERFVINFDNLTQNSTTNGLSVKSGNTNYFRVSTDGRAIFGNNTAGNIGIWQGTGNSTSPSPATTDQAGLVLSYSTGATIGTGFYFRNGTNQANTSGEGYGIRTSFPWNPTSGTGNYTQVSLGGTLNQLTSSGNYKLIGDEELTKTANSATFEGIILEKPDVNGFGAATAHSRLHVSGSFATGYVAKTATYTATIADHTIECTANTFTVTLPTAVGIAGRIYVIANSGAGVITIATTSSQTFVNVPATPTTLSLAAVGAVTVQSNGANWLQLSGL